MRERYLEVFDKIWIDNLNGDKYKTGKLTPEGEPDPSIFSTAQNREGIQVGTAIGLLVRTDAATGEGVVRFRHLWGRQKREELLESLDVSPFSGLYDVLAPPCALGLPFTPTQVAPAYLSWPLLPELFPEMSPGVKTSRDLDLVDVDLSPLHQRMEFYFNSNQTDEEVCSVAPSLMTPSGRFDPQTTRRQLLQRGLASGSFVRYCYRPFDDRFLFWHPETKLLDEKRQDLFAAFQSGNLFLTSRQKAERQREGSPFFITRALADWHLTRPGCACFPLFASAERSQTSLFETPVQECECSRRANLSQKARDYLASIGLTEPDACADTADLLWMHALAVGHTPAYLSENASALCQDWPRVPLPASREVLQTSAELGRLVVALLNPETPVPGVTAGTVRPALRAVGVPTRVDGGTLRPDELAVTAGWGHAGQGGVTMPARGKAVERDYTVEERAALLTAAAHHDLPETQVFACLGETTYDIYLNDAAYWRNVPARVWAYTLGGYQVLKKWLSYRERPLLGRALTTQEVLYVAELSRRISALLLLEPKLDEFYQAVKLSTFERCE